MENSRGKPNGLVWGLWLGLSVMGGVSVYYYPLFVLTMFVVPAIWAAMAFRTHPMLLAVAGALVFLFGYMMGYGTMSCLCILGMVAPAGICLWYSQRERLGTFQSVLYVAVLLTFGLFLIFCVPDLLETGDPYASLRSYFSQVPAMFEGTYLYDTAKSLVSRIDEMIVACFFAFAGAYALFNVLLLHAFNRKQKDMPLCPLGAFGTWYAPYGYVMVLGGLGLLATLATAVVDSATLTALSLLLYEMWALPLLVTGANALYSLLGRRLPMARLKLIYGLLLGSTLVFAPQFGQILLLLLGLTGVIRRRRIGKEQR